MPPRRTFTHRRFVRPVALLLVAIGSTACLTNSRGGAGLQYIAADRDAIAGAAFGLVAYELRRDSMDVGWFGELHGATDGHVSDSDHAPAGYDGGQDLVIDRMTSILSANIGPTMRITDWLHAYGGVGFGFQWDTEQRLGPLTVSQDGTYKTTTNRSHLLSTSFGAMLPFADGGMVGIGWDTLLEGPVFTLGLIW